MDTYDAYRPWLDHPGTLIAALPAMLGFVPEQSMVLVTMDRNGLGCAMRADLSDDAASTARQMAEVAASSGPDLAVLVFVDGAGASCRMCNDDYRLLADEVTAVLDAHGVVLWAGHVVDRIADGGRWHCVDGCGHSGVVDDPAASPLAAAAVLDGRRLYRRRDELVEIVAATDADRARGLADLIGQAGHGGGDRPAAAARRDVEHVIAAAAALAEGETVTDGDVARIACALTDPRVRDTLYALCVGRTSDQVEALWSMLARVLPVPWRSEALVLLAFTAYTRGDGPLAGVSLEAALQANPDHRMARLLDQALQTGMRPERIRELARTGYRMAKRIGVELPPFGLRAC
ncbi:DUF4192 domain-containing protein [Mycolicibacterium arenosum]|uniref:DUF4192 domain-containing protein n=1 Tax=Mycolicibacterium arenosum TaxID=2952157 RepID=A0ABT1M1S7_9MYCO|nr:DUF4192 domain-containing protein [Mycolicibacterium sp. CAU 1645]MCP9273091.1 DUF4192 domain-containing protein [Mycolicibacterium sp. CAU 1645]